MPFIGPLLIEEWPLLDNQVITSINHGPIVERFVEQKVRGNPVGIKVARVDNQAIGVISYYKYHFFIGHIDYLAVSNIFRNKGIATQLIKVAEEELIKQGQILFFNIWVLGKNTVARTLYEKLGYQNGNENYPDKWLTYVKLNVYNKYIKGTIKSALNFFLLLYFRLVYFAHK